MTVLRDEIRAGVPVLILPATETWREGGAVLAELGRLLGMEQRAGEALADRERRVQALAAGDGVRADLREARDVAGENHGLRRAGLVDDVNAALLGEGDLREVRESGLRLRVQATGRVPSGC